MHRALQSLIQEIKMVDWYQQCIDAAQDADLRTLLSQNCDEEKEHASVVFDWIRRHDLKLDTAIKAQLFKAGDVAQVEEETSDAARAPVDPMSEPAQSPLFDDDLERIRRTVETLRNR
jgi:hypothetical protein